MKTSDLTSKHIRGLGSRKEAVARVWLMEGNSQVMVNGKPISQVFRGPIFQKFYQRPFELTKTLGKYTATIKVIGGGQSSQLGAIVHGLSRALVKADAAFKPDLRKAGLLTRDPRVKERRKYGLAHKARAQKQSPKR